MDPNIIVMDGVMHPSTIEQENMVQTRAEYVASLNTVHLVKADGPACLK
jgi:hypothetical protein